MCRHVLRLMKKNVFLAVAIQLLLLSTIHAQGLKDAITDAENNNQTKLIDGNSDLVEIPFSFQKGDIELSKATARIQILPPAYSAAFDNLIIQQNPTQTPQLNEAEKGAEVSADANQTNEYSDGKFKWDSA